VIKSLSGIDWREFFGRQPLPPPSSEIGQAFAETRLLITGAEGSIGYALALRVAHKRTQQVYA
jgi:FlaA1/EpsC-like NDP-sugar epimerase